MHSTAYSLNMLFAQLGLDDDDVAIEQFIARHAPIPMHYRLWEAPCWNTGQAALLREELANDADWSEIIDQLNTRLRSSQ